MRTALEIPPELVAADNSFSSSGRHKDAAGFLAGLVLVKAIHCSAHQTLLSARGWASPVAIRLDE